jgi:trehalose/maltose hydrolase-like predicted phosphorylase
MVWVRGGLTMPKSRYAAAAILVGSMLAATGSPKMVPLPAAAHPRRSAGSPRPYLLTARHVDQHYAPTYTGNGYLGVRVPPSGQGYAGGSVPTQSEAAGFYAKPPGKVVQRANIPTWSTLGLRVGNARFSMTTGHVSHWTQQLNLRDGVITTRARWRAPDGQVTDLAYQVFTDRARRHAGIVRLSLTPRWSGRATVADRIDGKPATLTEPGSRGWASRRRAVYESVHTKGTGIAAGLASRLQLQANRRDATTRRIKPQDRRSVGQRLSFPVRAGHRYTVTKYVGVVTSHEAGHPLTAARRQARHAQRRGFDNIRRENRAAWRRQWAGRIDIRGDPGLAAKVNASQFYLWASTRPGVDWSISPAGLSSNDYNGHIFWDAETWMYPALLAQHPALAAGMNSYRFKRLHAAEVHARNTGYRGARFPWESALNGTEQIPPPVSVNSEGLYEQHITADIALAQWQYYLATGDRHWLRHRGFPVIKQAARFWASRVTRDRAGRYHIRHVTGPDEENPNVNDEAYTNVAAAATLRIGTAAAAILGRHAPASWNEIAARLVLLYDPALGIHPEFRGYRGQLIKQSDVTMLQYPWARRMPHRVAQRDLNYYVPRTDPDAPSMSDSVNNIDTAALGSPGCAAYVYTQRSMQPFIRDAFDQFSETRNGGAFTFMTGIGGFLQEFLYGYSGLRMGTHAITVDPLLTRRLPGIVLHRLRWHNRIFTLAIGRRHTRLTLRRGRPMTVRTRGGTRMVTRHRPLTIRTRRPDHRPTADVVRCARAQASSARPGMPALAAVDGSPATGWQPTSIPARLRVPVHSRIISRATLRWGRKWPPAPKPNVSPPPRPVRTLRPASYQLLVSNNGHSWRPVARVHTSSNRTRDTVTFGPVRARYIAVRIEKARPDAPHPMLEELTVKRMHHHARPAHRSMRNP